MDDVKLLRLYVLIGGMLIPAAILIVGWLKVMRGWREVEETWREVEEIYKQIGRARTPPRKPSEEAKQETLL
jgi:hypothetical protein